MGCERFRPSEGDVLVCAICTKMWQTHTKQAQAACMDHEANEVILAIELRLTPRTYTCTTYTPFVYAGRWTMCSHCGGKGYEHHISVITKAGKVSETGATKDVPALTNPCNHYAPSVANAGRCVCGRNWIEHATTARGDIAETLLTHSSWCRSVSHLGDQKCNCMSNLHIQLALENNITKHACSSFDDGGNKSTICVKCREPFIHHSKPARDGHVDWRSWHQAHMSNGEVIAWYLGLATTDALRIQVLEAIVKHGSPAQRGCVMPNIATCRAILECVGVVEVADRLMPKAISHKTCNSCGEPLKGDEEWVCDRCNAWFQSPGVESTIPFHQEIAVVTRDANPHSRRASQEAGRTGTTDSGDHAGPIAVEAPATEVGSGDAIEGEVA